MLSFLYDIACLLDGFAARKAKCSVNLHPNICHTYLILLPRDKQNNVDHFSNHFFAIKLLKIMNTYLFGFSHENIDKKNTKVLNYLH